jgi:septation ring formation regulator EzrA
MGGAGKDQQLGKRLLQIKEELEKKKIQRSELQGELKSLLKQLKEFGAETTEYAAKMIAKQEVELKNTERQIQKGIEEIKKLMEG